MEPPRDGEFLIEPESDPMEVRLAQSLIDLLAGVRERIADLKAFVIRYPMFSIATAVCIGVIGSSLIFRL